MSAASVDSLPNQEIVCFLSGGLIALTQNVLLDLGRGRAVERLELRLPASEASVDVDGVAASQQHLARREVAAHAHLHVHMHARVVRGQGQANWWRVVR
jgi:hypothetical protein